MVPIRAERKARGWSVRAMAERLRAAADRPDDMTSVDSLMHNIFRWERGETGMTERYRHLYCRVFGRTEFDLFGIEPPEIPTDAHGSLPPPAIPAGTTSPGRSNGSGYVLLVLPPGPHRVTIDITVTGEDKEPDSAPGHARMFTVVKDKHPGKPDTNRPPETGKAERLCAGCSFPLSRYNPGNLCQACVRAENGTHPAGQSCPAMPG